MVALLIPWSLLLLADGLSGGRAWVAITSAFGTETPVHLWEKKAAEGGYALAVLIWPALGFLLARRRPILAFAALGAATVGMAGLSAWSGVAAVFAGLGVMLMVGALGVVGGRVLGIAAAGADRGRADDRHDGAEHGIVRVGQRLAAAVLGRTDADLELRGGRDRPASVPGLGRRRQPDLRTRHSAASS
jgi:hypothetical protein